MNNLNDISCLANALQNNINSDVIEEKYFMDFYQLVKTGKIVPVTDEENNIIGFNTVTDTPTTLRCCKVIDGHLTVGDNEEERLQDEAKLKKFMSEFDTSRVMSYLTYASVLIEANVVPDDVIETEDDIYFILADKKQVININGDVEIDLSDDSDLTPDLPKKYIIKLLIAAFNSQD